LFVLNGVCLLLDWVFYRRFSALPVSRPVFVVGVPRSGTTFLHRELATDPAFSTTATWEATVAPAIIQRSAARALAAFDRTLGHPLARALSWSIGRTARSVNDVHPIGLLEAEEDYLLLLTAGGCFFMSLAFPGSADLKNLANFSALEHGRQQQLLDHYHRLLQRQLYANPGQLLSKNAAFASWLPALARRYPDALFVICIREPDQALASQVNSLAAARAFFATYPDTNRLSSTFAGYYRLWFRHLADFADAPGAAVLVIEQEWMRSNPAETLRLVYQHLQRTAPPGGRTQPKPKAVTNPQRGNSYLADSAAKSRASWPSYKTLQDIAVSQREITPEREYCQ
jgi:hypothetical protein